MDIKLVSGHWQDEPENCNKNCVTGREGGKKAKFFSLFFRKNLFSHPKQAERK
jgi:hypothetical protein